MPYQPGDILLGKYRIEALIGSGAFAEVYRVTHLELKVSRAIKILCRDTPGIGSTIFGDFNQRFQLEAQLGARLHHSNLIQVHDFVQVDETLVLVMEYASGGSLSDLIQAKREMGTPLSIDEALRIASGIAEGLAAIHALDAVHRDLKPSNILFDRDGRVKVADLGLAQFPGGPSMRSLISTGIPHPGTPTYMSPEQRDTHGHLTPASDIYALGLILFEMLTERVYRNLPEGTKARSLRPDIPTWLCNLLSQMLADDPRERPWDGEEALKLLQGHTTKRIPPASKSSKTKARQFLPWIIATGVLVSLVICSLIGVYAWVNWIQPVMPDTGPGGVPDTAVVTFMIVTSTPEPALQHTMTPQPSWTSSPVIPTLTDSPTPTITPVPAPSARFIDPQDGDAVGWRVDVTGKIEELKTGMRAFLCIQSTAFNQYLYPQGEIFPGTDGKWVVEGVYQTVGYDYLTYVVATDNHQSAEMLADPYYRSYGMSDLPAGTTIISPIITVTRK